MLKTAWYVFYAEWLLLLRRSKEWLYPLGFFIIVIFLFPFILSTDTAILQKCIPGAIWIAALLSSLLSIGNVFSKDMEEGHLEQLLWSASGLAFVLFFKLCAHWIVTALPLIVFALLFGFLFHLSGKALFTLFISLLLGTPILTFLGSFITALTLGLRQQTLLLGVLIFPLFMPVLIFALSMIQQVDAGFSIQGPLALLLGLFFLTVTLMPWAIACAIRIGLDD